MEKHDFMGFTNFNHDSAYYWTIFVMLIIRDTGLRARNVIGKTYFEEFARRFIRDSKGRTFFEGVMRKVVVDPFDDMARTELSHFDDECDMDDGTGEYEKYEKRLREDYWREGSKRLSPCSNRELAGLLFDHYQVVRDGLGYGRVEKSETEKMFTTPVVDMRRFREIFRHSKRELPRLIEEVVIRTDTIPYQFFQGEIRPVREVQRYENYLRMKRDAAKDKDLGLGPDNGCFPV
ncbi:hypothetical protein HAQ03_13375 [Acidithiobacillus caldus]|uniref:hypothetical protein n=1 Tax=Acidithiobacillus caldus TaxID=33059 RepID=UPI001C07DC51|nr:hypothetical protein [Acidithiobacillus caldus]MBU2764389.1 hypothetical protein [Acidithiobacillus caldus]